MWKPPSPPAPDAASVSPPPESNKMRNPGRRFAQTVRLKRDSVAAYKECHAKVWPEVEKQIRDCSIVDCKLWPVFPSSLRAIACSCSVLWFGWVLTPA